MLPTNSITFSFPNYWIIENISFSTTKFKPIQHIPFLQNDLTYPNVPLSVVVWSTGSHVSSRLTDRYSDSSVTVTRYHAPRTRVSKRPHRAVPIITVPPLLPLEFVDVAAALDTTSSGLLRDINNPDDSTMLARFFICRFKSVYSLVTLYFSVSALIRFFISVASFNDDPVFSNRQYSFPCLI